MAELLLWIMNYGIIMIMFKIWSYYNESYEIFESKKIKTKPNTQPFKINHNTDFTIAFFNL